MRRIKLHPTERDLSIMMELWRWKLLTTKAIHEKFFEGSSYTNSRVRLWELRKKKLIECRALNSIATQFAWTLTEEGFSRIKDQLPELKEEGFASETLDHDILTTAFHLGDWLKGEPSGAELFSEQELRRIHPDCYPDWVPKTERRRPDGYSRVPIKDYVYTFAFEIELTQKKDFDYRGIASFYNDHEEIDRVVWLVKSDRFAETIAKKFKSCIGDKYLTHLFVSRPSFEKSGWDAKIISGYEAGLSLSKVLNSTHQQVTNKRWSLDLLDKRKCLLDSMISKTSKFDVDSDRLCKHSLYPYIPNSQKLPSLSSTVPTPNKDFIKEEESTNEKKHSDPNRNVSTS